MAGRKSRNKGATAEREVISLLQPIVDKAYLDQDHTPTLKRNLMQYLEGGSDIIGIDSLSIEVKRCERLSVNSWWRQTLSQTKPNQIPVLFFRQSFKPWTIATILPGQKAVTHMALPRFLDWFFKYLLLHKGHHPDTFLGLASC